MDFLSKLGEVIEDIEEAASAVMDFIDLVFSFFSNDFSQYYDIKSIAHNMHAYTSTLIGSSTSYSDAVAFKVYDALIPIAAGLLLIYFAMHITDLVITEKFNVENFLKSILFMFFALWVMDNAYGFMVKAYEAICAYDISGASSSLTSDIINKLDPINQYNNSIDSIEDFIETFLGLDTSGYDLDSSDAAVALVEWVKFITKYFLNALVNLVFLPVNIVIGLILILIMEVRLILTAAKRAVKIAVHMALAPIAFANCFGDAMTRSGGFRHFLRIISLFVQGPIILIGVKICVHIVNDVCGPGKIIVTAPYFLMLFILNINLKKIIKQSEGVSDELFGL